MSRLFSVMVALLLTLVVLHETTCVDVCCDSGAEICCSLCGQVAAPADVPTIVQPSDPPSQIVVETVDSATSLALTPPHPPPKSA